MPQVGEAEADRRGDQSLRSLDDVCLHPSSRHLLTTSSGYTWGCALLGLLVPQEARAPPNGKKFINHLFLYWPGEDSPLQEFVA